jgi:hypothetical protein
MLADTAVTPQNAEVFGWAARKRTNHIKPEVDSLLFFPSAADPFERLVIVLAVGGIADSDFSSA